MVTRRRLQVEDTADVRWIRFSAGPWESRDVVELSSVIGDTAETDGTRVVVVASAGPDFCVGAADDLDPAASGVDPPAELAALRCPVIAALRGRVSSVGLELALAADIRVGSPDVVMCFPEVLEGRIPCWGGTQRLPRLAGRPLALAMLLLGSEVGADQALRHGLVQLVTTDLDEAVAGLSGRLARLAPVALTYAKEAVVHGVELPMRDGLRLEADLNLLLQTSRDRAEGIAAFLEKRTPTFLGE